MKALRFWALMPIYVLSALVLILGRREFLSLYEYEEAASFDRITHGTMIWALFFILFFRHSVPVVLAWMTWCFLVLGVLTWNEVQTEKERNSLFQCLAKEILPRMVAKPQEYWSAGRMWVELRAQHKISDRVTIGDVRRTMESYLGVKDGPWRGADVKDTSRHNTS